jgi:hypothetical protein
MFFAALIGGISTVRGRVERPEATAPANGLVIDVPLGEAVVVGYPSWASRVRVASGVVRLDGDGLPTRGGAGSAPERRRQPGHSGCSSVRAVKPH